VGPYDRFRRTPIVDRPIAKRPEQARSCPRKRHDLANVG
jgi:hypothetical protein